MPKRFFLFDAKPKTKTKKIEPVQNILYWFKIFYTGSKNFVLVQKFCTGSEKIVPKAKIELQHIYAEFLLRELELENDRGAVETSFIFFTACFYH